MEWKVPFILRALYLYIEWNDSYGECIYLRISTILSFPIPSPKNEDLCMKSDEIYETKFEISEK